MSYIRLEQIEKSFDAVKVLNRISIDIGQGEFITLLGPSGCGKTTLLRCLAGLEQPDGGRILIDGKDATSTPPKDRNISMIFQQYSLFPTMTVYKNIAFGLKMQKLNKSEIRSRVADALKMVDLTGSENKFPAQLSGGEQQRVALARSIVTNAKILLLDEPFSAIDAKLRKALQIQIKEIHDALGMTTVFVTHDQEEAMRMSDRIYLMNGGQVEQEGSPMELYLNPGTTFAAGFMGHCNLLAHDAFRQVISPEEAGGGFYAIRPENIRIGRAGNRFDTAHYHLGGIVRRVIPQGNFIRYTVSVNGTLLDVDTLFEAGEQFKKNDEVFLSIDKDLIIHFQ